MKGGLFSKGNLMKYGIGAGITLFAFGKIMQAKNDAAKNPEAKNTVAYKIGDFFGLI